MTALLVILFAIFPLICYWRIFEKAGRQGILGIIPIVNAFVLLDIIKRPVWWLILLFIPVVNIFIGFLILDRLSKSYNRDTIFTLGMLFLPFIFLAILAFGSNSVYTPIED